MRTVGEILSEARRNKSVSLEDAEKATKIRVKFLKAIEADDFSRMPSLSYSKGFVKNYSEYLGLNSATVLAFFRRQTVDTPKSSLLPRGMGEPLNRSAFQLTPGKFIFMLLLLLTTIFFSYLGVQYQSLQRAPLLEIETPAHQTVTSDKRIDIIGKTIPDATVTINGISVLVRADGKFFDQYGLEYGVNRITIIATSRLGKVTSQVIEVGLK